MLSRNNVLNIGISMIITKTDKFHAKFLDQTNLRIRQAGSNTARIQCTLYINLQV